MKASDRSTAGPTKLAQASTTSTEIEALAPSAQIQLVLFVWLRHFGANFAGGNVNVAVISASSDELDRG